MAFLGNLLQLAFLVLSLLVLARVFLSWIDPVGRTQLGAFVISATEPMLAPIRRRLPPMGMVDLSPLIVLILLSVLWRLL